MKVAPLAEVKTQLSAYIARAQQDRLLITRHGRPVALLIGVEGESLEDLMTSSDPEFWRLIEGRRAAGQVVSEATARRRLGFPSRRATRKRGA